MAALVREYYVLLRSLLRAKPHLRRCLTRCRHCRIFMLAHPRNAARDDLGCAFGCRQTHRKQESTRRSVEHYRGVNGRILKGYQNEKRRKVQPQETPPRKDPDWVSDEGLDVSPLGPSPCPAAVAEALPKARDPLVIEHVRVVVSLIEGRRVGTAEVFGMLVKVLRQRSIGRRRKIDHTLWWLNANPP